jgi:hypothetical protein
MVSMSGALIQLMANDDYEMTEIMDASNLTIFGLAFFGTILLVWIRLATYSQ